jgi:hypothetical protein
MTVQGTACCFLTPTVVELGNRECSWYMDISTELQNVARSSIVTAGRKGEVRVRCPRAMIYPATVKEVQLGWMEVISCVKGGIVPAILNLH